MPNELRFVEDDCELAQMDPDFIDALGDERLWREVDDAAALCEELRMHGMHVAFTGSATGRHRLSIQIVDRRGRCLAIVPSLAVVQIDELRRLAGV